MGISPCSVIIAKTIQKTYVNCKFYFFTLVLKITVYDCHVYTVL